MSCYFLSDSLCFSGFGLGEDDWQSKENRGLYFLDDGAKPEKKFQDACFESISVLDDVMIWHYRLGHPSFSYLKNLLPSLFKNKKNSSFQCEVCQIAKHHRSSFPSRPYQASKPFMLIHSDVWGPCRTSTMSGKKNGSSLLLMIILG